MGGGSGYIQMLDPSSCDAACSNDGVDHAVWMVVGGVPRSTGHFEDSLPACDRLADAQAVRVLQGGDLIHEKNFLVS
jgi:hypothetical protein